MLSGVVNFPGGSLGKAECCGESAPRVAMLPPRYRALMRLNGTRSEFHARAGPGGLQHRKCHFQ